MVRPGRERLHGSVEVDETYVGSPETGGKRGRGTENEEIVAIAVEVLSPRGFGCDGSGMSQAIALCPSSAM